MESIFTCYTEACPVTYVLFGHDIEKLSVLLAVKIRCHFCGQELGYVDHATHGWLDTRREKAATPRTPRRPGGREWKPAQGAFDFRSVGRKTP